MGDRKIENKLECLIDETNNGMDIKNGISLLINLWVTQIFVMKMFYRGCFYVKKKEMKIKKNCPCGYRKTHPPQKKVPTYYYNNNLNVLAFLSPLIYHLPTFLTNI